MRKILILAFGILLTACSTKDQAKFPNTIVVNEPPTTPGYYKITVTRVSGTKEVIQTDVKYLFNDTLLIEVEPR